MNYQIILGMKMKNLLFAIILIFNIGNINAETINFDDLPGNSDPVPDGYKGLNWNNANSTGVIDANPYLVSGADYTGFKDNVLFNSFGYLAANSTLINVANGGTLDYLSGYWGPGITGDGDIFFEGYVNNILTYTSNVYNLTSNSTTLIELNWFGLDSLVIGSTANVWTADSLEINVHPSAVPLPAAAWLFGSAILAFAGLRRNIV